VSFDPVYEYRTGIGTDIHRVVEGRKLMLGGILVPWTLGLLGHSDGDVALHAAIDAMIGAAGMGDIGTFFPDTEAQWKDVDSRELLVVIRDQIKDKAWEVVNIDLIIHAEEPKLGAYKGQMRRAIASILGIDFMSVNVKAKTNEGMGEIGQSLAMAATASVLLRRRIKRML
jgi:2-C-methyl-D-erythritol 2,4-cyclodiphosphate synthase